MLENKSAVQVGNDIYLTKSDGSRVVYSDSTLLGYTSDSITLKKNNITYTYYINGNVKM